jgi:hypothetical protein
LLNPRAMNVNFSHYIKNCQKKKTLAISTRGSTPYAPHTLPTGANDTKVVGFEDLTVVTTNSTVLWVVMLCDVSEKHITSIFRVEE